MARSVREAVRWTAATQCTVTAKEARPSTGKRLGNRHDLQRSPATSPPADLAPSMRFPCKAIFRDTP